MKRVLPVRIPVYIDATVVAKGKSYGAIIGNLSHNGAFLETVPTKAVTPFIPGKRLELTFRGNSKKNLSLSCEVIWLYTKRNDSDSLVNSIGIEILNPPPAYKKFFKSL